MKILHKAVLLVLSFFFPRSCMACGQDLPYDSKALLCNKCEKELKIPGPLICKRCGVELKDGGAHCFNCRGHKEDNFKCKLIRSAFVFNTSSRALVHALKYQGADYAGKYMGRLMAARYKELPELANVDVLVPVVLFKKRLRKRGYNQSEVLARALGQILNLPVDSTCLTRTRNTPSQTKLGRKARLENMTGAFRCVDASHIKRKTVLLIDDVATTGATLEGCAQALKSAGAKRVFAYTFAREN